VRADGPAGLAVAVALAVVWLGWLLPPGFVGGTSSWWQTDLADTAGYLSGFNAFFSAPWGWPLLRVESLNAPDGTLATYLDVVPLYASLLKLVAPSRWFPFNPFGYWIALCYVLLGVGAWWLIREARLPRYPALITLTCLLLAMPALTARLAYGHVSLMSQWLIVFALALYLRSARRAGPSVSAWSALLVLAFYVNLYIFVMVGLVFVADVARAGSGRSWARALVSLSVPVVLIGASLPLTMLPLPHAAPAEGFGFYSMNLLAPFVGGGRATDWLGGDRQWTFVGGQYEGYNYLGAGGWLVVLIAAAVRLRHDRDCLRRHRMLVAALALATVYALSHRVYLGHRLVLEWPLPSWLGWWTGAFRASGRFFWPLGYALTIAAVITCARWLTPWLAAACFAAALILQGVDLQPAYAIVRPSLERPAARILDSARWDTALGPGIRTLVVEPKYGCGRTAAAPRQIRALQRHAAERRLRLNTGHLDRYAPPCDTAARDIAGSDRRSTAYVFLRGEVAAEEVPRYFPAAARLSCEELDVATVCRWPDGS
jgi:Family of unknown function (DUF6311)